MERTGRSRHESKLQSRRSAGHRKRSTAMAEAHVLVFPCPAQGHINSMLPFAAALLDAGVFVTFLHTDHNLRRASTSSPSWTASPTTTLAR